MQQRYVSIRVRHLNAAFFFNAEFVIRNYSGILNVITKEFVIRNS